MFHTYGSNRRPTEGDFFFGAAGRASAASGASGRKLAGRDAEGGDAGRPAARRETAHRSSAEWAAAQRTSAPLATRLLVAAALLLPLIGCGPQADPNPMRAPGATNSTSVDASGTVLSPGVPGVTRTATSGEPATSEPQTPYNTSFWETVQVQDDKVGFAHTRIHPEPAFDKDALVIESRQVVRLRRYDQETRQEISVTSTETRDGRLLHFQARVTSGAEVTRTNGAVRDADALDALRFHAFAARLAGRRGSG